MNKIVNTVEKLIIVKTNVLTLCVGILWIVSFGRKAQRPRKKSNKKRRPISIDILTEVC